MKKLTKKSLDELAKTMSVIPENEQENYWGMYNNDCFWRCVAYMASGGTSFSPAVAESYALDYYTNGVHSNLPGVSSYVDTYLNLHGAGMSIGGIQDYIRYAVSQGSYTGPSSSGEYIGFFNTNNISSYNSTGGHHAVIVRNMNSDGSLDIFDPQNPQGGTIRIPANEVMYIQKVMY
ncbi:hypothetical protein SAMN05216357_111108 [Porphyromonadaceae bacterium KH3CP3RA]|nr:hypothetical protein SAMN05216357_111108 [Porphyromonadaceae bacterium KH3CP3RA]